MPSSARRPNAIYEEDDDDEYGSQEEQDFCMPLSHELIAADDDLIAQEESLVLGTPLQEEPGLRVPLRDVSEEMPLNLGKVQTSLEHLRIKTIETNSEDSEMEGDEEVVLKFTESVPGTYEQGSIVNMALPDVMLLSEVKSGFGHKRHTSREL